MLRRPSFGSRLSGRCIAEVVHHSDGARHKLDGEIWSDWKMSMTNNNAQRLTEYQQRLRDSGFKRISAYVSTELVGFLQSRKVKGECVGRTLERLLLGSAKTRPQYYSDEETAAKEACKREWAAKRVQTRKPTKTERRAKRRSELDALRLEVMQRLGLADNVEKS